MPLFFDSFMGVLSLRGGCLLTGIAGCVMSILWSCVIYNEYSGQPTIACAVLREWWQLWTLVRPQEQFGTFVAVTTIMQVLGYTWSFTLTVGSLLRLDTWVMVSALSIGTETLVLTGFHWYLLFWHQCSPNFRIHLFCSIFVWIHWYCLFLKVSYYRKLMDRKKHTDEDYMITSFILPHRRRAAEFMEALEARQNAA